MVVQKKRQILANFRIVDIVTADSCFEFVMWKLILIYNRNLLLQKERIGVNLRFNILYFSCCRSCYGGRTTKTERAKNT
jgi:hypothetical protein